MYRLRSQCASRVLRQLQMCGIATCGTRRLLSSTSSSSSSTSSNDRDSNGSGKLNKNEDAGSKMNTSEDIKTDDDAHHEQPHKSQQEYYSSGVVKEQTSGVNDNTATPTNNTSKNKSTGNSDSNTFSKNNSSATRDELWSLERDTTIDKNTHHKSSHYHFPTQDVLNAVKKGDFDKIQAHATALVKHNWRDEYVIPTYCVAVFLLCWWFAAWRSRALRRRCNKLITSIEHEASQMVERVRGLTEKYAKDMVQAQQRMEGIIDKNSALTADIDRMTTILRSCSIKPTP